MMQNVCKFINGNEHGSIESNRCSFIQLLVVAVVVLIDNGDCGEIINK